MDLHPCEEMIRLVNDGTVKPHYCHSAGITRNHCLSHTSWFSLLDLPTSILHIACYCNRGYLSHKSYLVIDLVSQFYNVEYEARKWISRSRSAAFRNIIASQEVTYLFTPIISFRYHGRKTMEKDGTALFRERLTLVHRVPGSHPVTSLWPLFWCNISKRRKNHDRSALVLFGK